VYKRQNDGWRDNPNWANSNHTIWINENAPSGTHYCDYSYIYNNTVIIDRPYSTAIDIDGKNTHIFNNIFYSTNGSGIGEKQVVVKNNGTDLYMRNNLYFGAVNGQFKALDNSPVNGDPLFVADEDETVDKYQVKSNSPAVNAGVANTGPPIPGAGTGVFKDVPEYPTVDFYGNPIDLSSGTPNIGASNAKDIDSGIYGYAYLPKLIFAPNPTNGIINFFGLGKPELMTLYSLDGETIMQKEVLEKVDISRIDNGVYIVSVNGYRPNKLIKR
jgi:hypothetical protein